MWAESYVCLPIFTRGGKDLDNENHIDELVLIRNHRNVDDLHPQNANFPLEVDDGSNAVTKRWSPIPESWVPCPMSGSRT